MQENKESIRHAINRSIQRHRNPTKGDKRFETAGWVMLGCSVLFLFTFLATGLPLAAWLMDGALVAIPMLGVAAIIWRLLDRRSRMMVNGQRASPTPRPSALRRASVLTGAEQVRGIGKTMAWQYGLALLFLLLGVLLPVSILKIVSWCLMDLALLWAIHRIWRYHPSHEEERYARLSTIKLGWTLLSAGFIVVSMFIIMLEVIVAGRVFISSILSLILLPLCGFFLFFAGCMLIISMLRTDSLTSLHNEENP